MSDEKPDEAYGGTVDRIQVTPGTYELEYYYLLESFGDRDDFSTPNVYATLRKAD